MKTARLLRLVTGPLQVGLVLLAGCGGGDLPAEVPCGPGDAGLKCAGGQVCVTKQFDKPTTYECAANPCGDQPLDCSCAATACSGQACANTEGHNVNCVCPNC